MKKLLTFLLTALLAFGVGWATEVTDVLTYEVLGLEGSYADFTGKTATSNAVYAGNAMKGSGNTIQLRSKESNSGIVTTTSGGKVKSITVVWNSSTSNGRDLMIYGKNTAFSSATELYSTGLDYLGSIVKGTDTSLTISGDYEYIGLRSQNGAMYITSITIVWETGGGATVAPPTITPNGGEFVTSQEVTLSHGDADAIYYTLDGSNPTTSSSQYSTPLTLTETTTVKAIAVKNGIPSNAATATFTKLTGVATVANANALADNTKFGFSGYAVVTYQNGNNLWIRDQTRDTNGSGLIYGSVSGTFANGAILDAGWTATKTTYNGVPEFTSPSGVSSSSSTTAAPEPLNTITTGDVNKYVILSNVTIAGSSTVSGHTNYTIGASYVLRDNFDIVTLTVGKTYNVVGVVSIYSNSPQLYLISAEEVAVPTLLVTPNPLTFNDSGTGNTFTVEGSNLGGDNVGLTQDGSYFTPSLTASTGWATDGGTYWYFSPNNGSLNGTVAMSYSGRELSASETVTLANNKASTTVTVNYRSDVYILGNYGNSGWDYSNGILMTYDDTNNTYTATITADVGDLIVFARKLGESNPWNTRILFGPNSNGDWWVHSSPNPKEGTIDLNDDDPIYFNCAGTYTIEINATTGALTVTREVVNTGDFELVTNVNDLNAGDEVIFVNSGTSGSALAMSTTQNNNNRGTTNVTVTPTLRVTADDPVQIATLEGGSSGWYFNVGDGSDAYLYAASSSSNYLRTQTTKNDNAKASITIGSGNVASIVFQGSNTRNTMQFNGSIVSCYASANQSPVYLYRRAGSTEPKITVDPTSLDLVIPASDSSVDGTVTVTETNTTGTTTVSISGDGASHFTATLNNGILTVTYSGTATQANPDEATIILTNGNATATVTVTGYKRVQATGTLYTKVTSTDQIQDGLQYILVYEGTPEAINDITTSTGGTGADVIWETQGSVVNIDNTDVIEFTLVGDATSAKFHHGDLYLGRSGNNGLDNNSETVWKILENAASDNDPGGFYLAVGTESNAYRLRYNTGMGGNDKFRCYSNNTGAPVYLYVQGGTAGVATPVITPASGAYSEGPNVTITCGTAGATIYYTENGGETQTYNSSFPVLLDEEHTSVTIVAWAVKDELTSEQATVTYTFKNLYVNSIEEFKALNEGDSAYFKNPVVVLFDYSQNSDNGQEYIWVKDRTGYTQFFIAPQFDAESVADPQYNGNYNRFWPKYENGDVIPAGFKVKKGYFEKGDYYQGQCYETHHTFLEATEKSLADPEQVTLSELINDPAAYNDRYLFINKLKVTSFQDDYGTYGKWEFYVAADENDDNVAEVYSSTIVGYNKYNSPAWKNKQGQEIGVTVPTDGAYYNVKFIFQKYSSKYELMPIEFTPWKEDSLLLEDLVEVGVEDQQYTISNQLHAAAVTWDDNYKKFAIFAKDDEMYANKRYPTATQESYLIEFENQDGTFVNTVEQEDYDQSNWIEILIPSDVTTKPHNDYQTTLDTFKAQFENKILKGGTVKGTYKDELNPTIEVTTLPTVESSSTYTPNIFCTANFLMENLDANGALSYRADDLGGDYYFMMDAKPHEFCKVVWAYKSQGDNYFVAPAQEGDRINGHKFRGSFLANMSLCEDATVTSESTAQGCFTYSGANSPEKLYGFKAIVRKNPDSSVWGGGSNGAPRRIQPYADGEEANPAYIVYPLNSETSSTDNVTAVNEILNGKTVVGVSYYNTLGQESQAPFEGINIVVTRYSDGTRSTAKVLK